ncbi:MAG TPA: glycosyltransferase family 1 protein [Vicinamibacteria bacterium]|nr:glycosyltransferase family 1 protein [Vicinamibacteria bacterium]
MPDPPSLTIGIDGRELQGRPTGTGRYLRNLLRAWPATAADRLLVYCAGRLPEDPALALPGVVPRALGSGHERGLWWAERRLARAAEDDDVDVLFCPAYTCPLTTARARVTAVHDLSFYAWPDDFAALDGIRRRLLVAASLRASRAVLACSDFTRREIAQRFPDLAPRVVHVPLAAAEDLPPSPTRDEARARLGARGPVILTAGAILNRRRLPVLLRAVASLRRAWPDLTLEVVGDNRTHPPLDLEALVAPLGGAGVVHVSGHVSDAGLAARYAAADVFVLLSEYEGFGLPVLEAMARGVPVVTSRRPALSEIFGVGALLVEPGDEDAVSSAIDRVLREPRLRADLVRRGQALAASFSWAETAQRTRRALARVARRR